ncbi:hypothetical protein I302_108188 [Kwoniella bestiolae CBS 10118]|uniref:Uncharacterized protein n=1 Tax=Kwoniella bestiolae CBS 10118 TaxID=1296100 RepID=A0A1B9FWE2_9TREE|nr:hypothetical protein I302_07446 [Kwoniella bestiolae CBS 10118]OCF23095.1 hypothetical protein I302_07446 [Kwoniella bestiolae CBS 10118]
MSLRSLRDTLYSLTGSSVPQDTMDAEPVWVAAGDGDWSHGNGNGLFGWRSLASGLGLGLGDHHHHEYHHRGMTDWRNLFFWLAVFAILILFAVITNPTESSFRAHLTELSFRRHLADIRRSETDEATPLTDEQAQLPSTSPSAHLSTSTPDRRGSTPGNGTETPTHTIAPFRFANHVAISLRTPTLLYRSFLICSITITSPLQAPAFLSDQTPHLLLKGKHASPPIKERHVLWFGCMGHWSLVGLVPSSVEWAWKFLRRSEREKGRKKNLDKAGVIDMRAIQNKEDSAPSVKAAIGHAMSGSKGMRRTDSSTNLTESLPLHSHSNQLSASPLSPESRRPSLVNLIASPPATATLDTPEIANSPVIIALKAELTAAQTVLTDLQAQLTSHEQSVSDAHAHLQKNLDEIRNRRKEDDAERQELKSRTKSLEEQKRQAEASRREAEKKLKSVEGIRDGLLSKISSAESEIMEIKGNMEISEKNVRVIQEEGAKHVVLTQLNVEERKKEMDQVENEISEMESKNEDITQLIKDAEERLKKIIEDGENAKKKVNPEEEMMMMAAAYEAAAQEGYLHSGYQSTNHLSPSSGPPVPPPPPGPPNGSRGAQQDQWQSQAAAYMAEAGMPHLGYDYTARPAHAGSTGFGHLSKHPNPNSASSRDLESMRRPDISGFEDFGPGGLSTGFGSHAQINRSTTPQPPSDSESDIYGQDPGSPYGGFSSSNLLPQGLFRSLEGDQTPFVSGDEDLPETFEEPLSFDLDLDPTEPTTTATSTTVSQLEKQVAGDDEDNNSVGSDSDEADEWKSPLPEPKGLKETKESAYKRLSSSSSRLLPPSNLTGTSGSPNTSPATISALPSLPGSRRWFSGTLSSDNIPSSSGVGATSNSAFGGFMHSTTSNDSLNLPGYENSPFAPTSSEKKALANWQPFGGGKKGPWSAFGSSNNKEDEDGSISDGWPTSTATNGTGNENKKPFRFFSLRGKPTTGSTPP